MPKVTEAHAESRRRQIILAACVCMARKGFHQTTMRDICRTAELSPGAVYSYYPSKEEILKGMAEEGLRSNTILFDRVRQAGDLRRGFLDLFRIVFECLREMQGRFDQGRMKVGLWAEAVRNPEILSLFRKNYRGAVEELAGIVKEGQERGQVSGSLDPGSVAQVLISLLEGYTLQRVFDPELDEGKYRETLAALFGGGFWSDPDRRGRRKK